jgi:hypothetical protein
LENSCPGRGDDRRTLWRRNPFAKQKIHYAAITGNGAEFCRRGERARYNFIHRSGCKLYGDKLSADKPAGSGINRFHVEFRIVPRIL